MKKIIFKSSTFIIALIYLIGVFIFGEVHPFSKYPMYSSFTNWAYVFYITDQNDSLIPCKKLKTKGGYLGHNFYSICQEKNIGYGDGMESNSDLKKVGSEMMQIVLNKSQNSQIRAKKLKLWRTYYYFKNDSILHKNQLIYENIME
jgi:hypothetical protein